MAKQTDRRILEGFPPLISAQRIADDVFGGEIEQPTIRKWVQRGRIRGHYTSRGGRGKLFIERTELERFLGSLAETEPSYGGL